MMRNHIYIVAAFILLFKAADGRRFKEADFVSEWLPLVSQGGAASVLDVLHGLGAVPDIVEVLVKPTSGPNENYTFKAMGTGERDDDWADSYGGVMYLYNHEYVKVLAPNRCNGYSVGAAIYTGEEPFWTGVNRQMSHQALVQVRCWTPSNLPAPCFNTSGHQMDIIAGGANFLEISHDLGEYPDYVKVRLKMTDIGMFGWYSDGQGSATGHRDHVVASSSGLKYGYNDSVVRVWAWGHQGSQHYLFEALDGWGTNCWNLVTKHGEVEVTAWCDIGISPVYETSFLLTPYVNATELELEWPDPILVHDVDVLLSFMVLVETGANAGFMFEGVGSAKSNNYISPASPCTYGGIIYAYSEMGIRLWRPDTDAGKAVCINEHFGGGAYAQGAANVTVIIRIWKLLAMRRKTEYKPSPVVCSHFKLAAADSIYNETAIGWKTDVTSVLECNKICHDDAHCYTFAFSNTTSMCDLYSTFNETLMFPESESQVWTVATDETEE